MNIEKRGTVLIVDDSSQNRLLAEDIIEDNGFQVLQAENGQSSLEIARKHKPDVILLDRMMPGMSGDEVCRILKDDEELKKIKIIVLSARASTTDRVDGLEFGADDYLTKPYQPEELVARVKVQYRTKMAEDALQKSRDEVESLIHILCHDLQNPIGAVQGFFEILTEMPDHPKDKKTRELENIVRQSLLNTQEIIEHVREMRALVSGKNNLELSPVSLKEIFLKAKTIFKKKLEEKNLRLNMNLEDGISDFTVFAEPVSLTNNVISNILSNAIKFSYHNGEINASINSDGDSVCLEISDRGMGMPEYLLKTVFRSDMPTTRRGTANEQGTGFGMPLVKKYIDLFGGRITVKSKTIDEFPDDHGTSVQIYLRRCEK